MKSEPRIAFVVDALLGIGGAEKTLFAALEKFPQADVFTLVHDPGAFIGTPLAKRRVYASWLNRLQVARTHHRLFLPLMPGAVERFDLRGYDTVLSFSYAVANGANAAGAAHLSYTHTPMRYAWRDLNIRGQGRGNNPLIDLYLHSFRQWDRAAARRIQAFAVISDDIARQVQADYGRKARVIYPPVETDRFHAGRPRGEYYAVVTRLVAHKRVDLIVDAFTTLGLPLKILGDGPEREQLAKRAGPNIEFLGYRPDAEVADLLSRARAFVSAAEEDFGIAIVEAQAAGCPVISYGKGGALETVVDGYTGLFFPQQSVDCVMDSVRAFERAATSFNSLAIADHARRFDKAIFQSELRRFVMEAAVEPVVQHAPGLSGSLIVS